MPFFTRKPSRTASATLASVAQPQTKSTQNNIPASPPQKIVPQKKPAPRNEDAWTKKEVLPEDVQELLHTCTQELKSRALDVPFFLLPFRPNSAQYLSDTRAFIRRYFKESGSTRDHTDGSIAQEIRLMEPVVLCSIVKWCWSRLRGGVITWKTYELFKGGEQQSNMDKQAFDTFLPLSTESSAHRLIILDFFDLLAAIAAHSRSNGLGGRKLSRFAGWWAFEHSGGKGFEQGYKSWASAADATSHMFFAYLRARAPKAGPGSDSISLLPRALQTLVSETEYPPQSPKSMQSVVPSVLVVVDAVSPTPFAMLRRAHELEYRDDEYILRRFAEYQDPVKALTTECRRVLDMLAASTKSSRIGTSTPPDASWTRFEDLGFSGLNGNTSSGQNEPSTTHSRTTSGNDFNTPNRRVSSKNNQSWADFMQTGFSDDDTTTPPPLAFPPKQYMPLINPEHGISPQRKVDAEQQPGELARIDQLGIDDAFWWVWMESLAPEESSPRKAVFGRCVFVELDFTGSRWLAIEEQVRAPVVQKADEPTSPLASPEKKRNFLSKKGRTFSSRQASSNNVNGTVGEQQSPAISTDDGHHDTGYSSAQSTPMIGTDQHALIQAAAAQLVQKVNVNGTETVVQRRGRKDPDSDGKTVSVLSMQPVFVKDAAPALQWARKFDKEIRSTRTNTGDAESTTSGARDVSGPVSSMPLAYASKEDVSAGPDGKAPVVNGPYLGPETEEPVPATAEDTPRKAMVPSPLNIPKRKPVGGGNTAQSNVSGNSEVSEASSPISQREQEDTVSQLAPAQRPDLQKSKTGSRHGLKGLFKRKVTDPTAKSSAQRAVSGDSTTGGQQEGKLSRKRSMLMKKLGTTPSSTYPAEETAAPAPVETASIDPAVQITEQEFKTLPTGTKYGPAPPPPDTSTSEHDFASNFEAGEPGPTMTSKSTNFGAARPDAFDNVTEVVPPSPAFSNFTSAGPETTRDRSETTSTMPMHNHTRTDTVETMPSYALQFDPGSPQKAQHIDSTGEAGFPSFKTRAAALLNPNAAFNSHPPRGSSIMSEEPSNHFSTAKTSQEEFHDAPAPVSTFAAAYLPTHDAPSHAVNHATSTATPADEVDSYTSEEDENDGAPRPNTQERLNTASSRWAAIRQTAHSRRISEQDNTSAPNTPPWQQQLPKGEGGASGFSPGPRVALAQRDGKGLGINGAGEGVGRESGTGREANGEVEEETIEARIARIKGRVAELTSGVNN